MKHTDSYDRQAVGRVLSERGHLDGPLMPVLHGVQDALGHVPEQAVAQIAQGLNLSRAEVHGVLTYYHHFRTQPAKRPVLQVCRAEACRSVGGEQLLRHAHAAGGCGVEAVYCLGLCAMAPAVMLEGQPYGRMTAQRLDDLLDDVGGAR
jgi:NADH:ubiquinone oxidoreductase 24 kD subunit